LTAKPEVIPGKKSASRTSSFNLPQARFSPAAVTYPITTNQTWELLRFHSKLEKSSDEVEDVKDDRPIGPASERSTFWPGI
jgi:hypothetical protein